MEVSIGLAFIAGLSSFLSPCVFSLVPAYISYLGGRSISVVESQGVNKFITFLHGLAFVSGFSLVFIIMGIGISALGGMLFSLKYILTKIGGVIVVLLGLHMAGILRLPFLYFDLRLRRRSDQQPGFISSFLMGIFFSAGWSPCVGPVLGAILTLALNGGSITIGAILLFAYSLGLAIPFLLAALGIGWATEWLKRYRKASHYIEIAMGLLLIVIGVMLFLGIFEQFIQLKAIFDFGL